MTNPTNEHKEQAREIVGSCVVDGDVAPSGRLYVTVAEETITDRIAAALSAKDAEIERLIASFKHAAWKGFNQSDSEFENGYKHAMTVAATAVESLLKENQCSSPAES